MPVASARQPGRDLPFGLMGVAGLLLLVVGLWRAALAAWPGLGARSTSTAEEFEVAGATLIATVTPPASTETAPATATLRPAVAASASAPPVSSPILAPSLIPAAATATPFAASWTACPNAPLSRLQAGGIAVVSFDPPLANRVRSEPGTQAQIVGQIGPGEVIEILDGPGCANDWVWWRIRSQGKGLTGWTSEGDRNAYWLVPVSPTPATPVSPRIHGFAACQEPCLAGGSNATRTFPGGATRIYAQWNYENIPTGARYIRTWTWNSQEWVRYECAWPGPASGIDTVSLREPDGLRSGNWEVTISVNGTVLLQEQVMVEGNWSYWYPAGVFNACYDER